MKARVEPGVLPHTVDVQIDQQFQAQVEPDPLHRAALATLAHQQVKEPRELAIVLADDTLLHELNLRHRGVGAPTDVLAFSDDADEVGGSFIDAPAALRYLGDVVISFHRAQAQAAEAGHNTLAELQLLVVHGVLHLLGHDDVAKEQRAQMWAAQAEIIKQLKVRVNLPASDVA